MLFNSLQFLIFFPIVVLIYYLIPHRIRHIWLLIVSYYFYMCFNPVYALLLLFITGATYFAGRLTESALKKNQDEDGTTLKKGIILSRIWVSAGAVICLLLLFFFKYFEFVVSSLFPVINALYPMGHLDSPALNILLPAGISFYTFQTLGYLVDVYRKDTKAEKNILRYALFVSFFPQLVSGPIGRSTQLLPQFLKKHEFEFEQVRDGLLLMLWGFFLKLVIADRIALFINEVFAHFKQYDGAQIFIAMLLFAIQIYCDFAGYSNIAIGAAQVMGFQLMNNFDCPYFGQTVADFWRRWHISLTSWFKDYLYIPLGGSRNGKRKRYRNIMIVFLASGLWHGASWHFVIWGGLNGLYQVVGYELKAVKAWISRKLHVDASVFSHKLLKVIVTFILVDIAWVFFKADTALNGALMLGKVITDFNLASLFDGSLYKISLSGLEFGIAMAAIAVLLIVDILHYRGMRIRHTLAGQGIWLRFLVYITALFLVLIFGQYGPGFDASQFIYFQF